MSEDRVAAALARARRAERIAWWAGMIAYGSAMLAAGMALQRMLGS